jgi:Gas vesicle synthesis protein GvpL/GvpF
VLYVYAFVRGESSGRLPRGGAGERLRLVACPGGVAVVGDVDRAPTPTVGRIRRHDRVVSGLARRFAAILPTRFGSVVAADATLAAVLAGRAEEIADALALVEGRAQMMLRLYGRAAPGSIPDDANPARGPGTRYLTGRMSAQRAAATLPELAPLRPALTALVLAERVERHRTPPLIATVYHLVERGSARTYLAAVAAASPDLVDVRVRASGPWAPYAFAPDTAS